MALRGGGIKCFLELWLLVGSGGFTIWVSSTSFQVASAGLNSLQQQEYQILVKNWIFADPLHKKGQVLVILVLGMIQPSGSVNFFMKRGCRGH